jgi:hypothetical protein
MIRRSLCLVAALAAAGHVILDAGSAMASPIDNSGLNCTFKFNVNGSMPFLAFSNGKTATNLASSNFFTADTDSSGNMSFGGSSMSSVPTNATLGINTISVRLQFTDVVGTTDLSGAVPNINWVMTAKAQFVDAADGISTVNCQTSTFTIYVSGNWGNTTSTAFTIPSLSGSGSGACNAHAAGVNSALGLGSSGATLTLYKFGAYNGTTPLQGS